MPHPTLHLSRYHIAGMDCPCEERLIRMTLEGNSAVRRLEFDLGARLLQVTHSGEATPVTRLLEGLRLQSRLLDTTPLPSDADCTDTPEHEQTQRRVLWWVLIINFAFFLLESLAGYLWHSMGLVADSLDMLADAAVYGMSLWAVGAMAARKQRVARLSGYIQLALAVMGLVEALRRFFGWEQMPAFEVMIGISALALLANATCLFLLMRTRSKEVHIRASILFSANDVLINLGVVVAALGVWAFRASWPDLVVGLFIFALVIRGGLRILRLARS